MKFDPLFTVKDNVLFSVDGSDCPALPYPVFSSADVAAGKIPDAKLCRVTVSWKQTGLSEDSYDESFLASLRDGLKTMEEQKLFAIIEPVADPLPQSEAEQEEFTASFKHCARRIKDCVSVIGFAVPSCVSKDAFVEELSAKHAHYVFFSSDDSTLADKSIARL